MSNKGIGNRRKDTSRNTSQNSGENQYQARSNDILHEKKALKQ